MRKQPAKVKYDDRSTTHVPERDGPWATWNGARYAAGAADNEARKIDALIKKAAKKQKLADSGKPRAPLEGRALEIANEHRDEKDLLRRDARAYLEATPKLPSESHPILRLWVQKLPKAKTLKVGHDKERVTRARSKLLGLREPYVVGDRDMLGFIRVDIDACFGKSAPGARYKLADEGWDELEARMETSSVPMANIGVGGCVDAGDFGNAVVRPHLIFLLKDSVYCGPKAQVKFRAKFEGVARRIVAAMIPLGADPGGLSNGCKSKNPLSPRWSHRIMREEPWTLDELETALPISVSQRQLERKYAAYLAARAPKAGVAPDHADPTLASESNQAHRFMCRGAQAAVRRYRATGTFDQFRAYVLELAMEVCPDPASASRKADYVAPWTWKHFLGRVPGEKMDPAALKVSRKEAAAKLNWSRSRTTMQAVMSAWAALPVELGRKPLVSEVAAWAGVSEKSARRYRPIPPSTDHCFCQRVSAPRHGVVKKVSAILGDGNETGTATPAPVESLLSELPSPGPIEALAPAPLEPVPACDRLGSSDQALASGCTMETVLPIPVVAVPDMPRFVDPSSLAPAVPPVTMADTPTMSATPGSIIPTARRMLPPPFARAVSNPGRSTDVTPTRSRRIPSSPAAAPPCPPGILAMSSSPTTSQPHHGG